MADEMATFKEIEEGEFMITTDVRHADKHFFLEDELEKEENSQGHWGYNPNSQSSQVQVIE